MRRRARYAVIALAALGGPVAAAAQDFPLILYEPGIDPGVFLPLAYNCPPAKDGTVELVKMNMAGGRVRFRVTFEGDAARHVSIERAWREAPFQRWHEFAEPGKRPDAEQERALLQAALSDAQGVRAAICFGVAAIREKYDKILEHNRLHMKPPRLD